MLPIVGVVVGALAGRLVGGEWGAIIGALVGFVAGALVTTQRERSAHRKPDAASTIASPSSGALAVDAERRIAALEIRVRELERLLHRDRDAALDDRATADAAHVASDVAATEPIVTPVVSDVALAPPTVAPALPEAPPTQRKSNALWGWFTGGNAMTRIGVVVLFFGVAFLLRYFAEHFTVPVEAKLLGVAAAGVGLVLLGLKVARTRGAYGWSLQGAGAGVLYITAFAAFREYGVIGAGAGFALLAIVAALTIWLALEADAQPLAALALAGAFLAPMLIGVEHEPVVLFSYFALVNAVVVVIAWRRPWRAAYLIGAGFTFVLALVWGQAYYRPEHYAVVQPFLALFFLMYVAIAVLQARIEPLRATAPIDGLLVFGVPLFVFALQAALVSDTTYGAAWSALSAATLYAALALALRRRASLSLRLLARAFAGLAVVFVTLAVPFALDNRWTAAVWSFEAVLVYWLGIEQRTPAMRALALLLQLVAGALFVATGIAGDGDRLFANAFFLGSMLVALAALITVWIADRHPGIITSTERNALPLLFAWGALWWLGGGIFELVRQLTRGEQAHGVLAWVVGSAFAALALRGALRWPRLEGLAWALPATMLFVGLRDIERAQTTLTQAGWLVWPLAWIVYARLLHTVDLAAIAARHDAAEGSADTTRHAMWIDSTHAASAIVLVTQIAWETSEWIGRHTASDTVWAACAAALPGIAYLLLIDALAGRFAWPFARHRAAYVVRAAIPIALVLALWVLVVNVLSPGEPHPLPYVPIANPLDITLALALWALFRWTAAHARVSEAHRYAALGFALFVAINGGILRVGHHWGSIAWDLSDLLASRPLQAAFTLAWTVTGAALMVVAARRAVRALWMVGAGLLAVVVIKLFAIDLATLAGLPRVVAFLGVGSLLLLIGYLSPLPPAARERASTM